jgi:Fic family protein
VVEALETSRSALTIQDVHNWYRRLMADSNLPPEMIGAFRTTQSWIEGTSPRDAALVPSPPELVGPLMEDLIEFINDEEVDPVSQAAVAHAQFETIHPYGDGNGRIGRILIGWILAHRLDVALPPPVSVFIARDPGGYLAGITMFRLGYLDLWVDWIAAALQHSIGAAEALIIRSDVLIRSWLDRLTDLRQGATARKVVDILADHPVVSSDLVASRLGVSERSGRIALRTLADRGIVQPYEKQPTHSRATAPVLGGRRTDRVGVWLAGYLSPVLSKTDAGSDHMEAPSLDRRRTSRSRPLYKRAHLEWIQRKLRGQKRSPGDRRGLHGRKQSPFCQGEGRGFESRRPLQRKAR